MCAAQSPVFCGQPVETFCSVKIHHSDCGVFCPGFHTQAAIEPCLSVVDGHWMVWNHGVSDCFGMG